MPEPTATNPQTGEKVVFRNGKWVPAGGGNTPASPAQPRAPMVGPGPDPHKQAAEERANRAEARAERTEARVASAAADAARRAEAQNIPNAAATGIQENISGLSKLDEALRLLDARPGSIGPGTGLFSDTFTQFNDPEGTDVRRALAEIGAIKIHDLSGAAVSASEAPRFMPFVPKVTDRPEVARKKLEGFKKEMAKVLEEADSYYSEANRFLPYSTPGMEALRQTNFGQGPNLTGDAPPAEDQQGGAGNNAGNGQTPPEGQVLLGHYTNEDGSVAPVYGAPGTILTEGDGYTSLPIESEITRQEGMTGEYGLIDLAKHGLSLGLTDEASGVGQAIAGLLKGDTNVGENYRLGRDVEQARIDRARAKAGWAGTAVEFLGGMALPANALTKLGSVRAAAKAGATAGGLGGFGYGRDQASVPNAMIGAVAGTILGTGGQKIGNALAARTPRIDPARAAALNEAGQAERVTVNRAMVDPQSNNAVSKSDASLVGGRRVQRGMQQIEGQIEGRVADLGRGGQAMDNIALGDKALTASERFIAKSGKAVRAEYDAAEKLAGNAKVPPTQSLRKVEDMLASMGEMAETNAAEISYLTGLKSDLSKDLSVGALRKMRTKLRQKISKGDLTFGEDEARVLSIMDSAAADIEAGLVSQGKGDAARAFRAADTSYRDRMEYITGTLQKLIGKRNSSLSAEQIAGKFMSMTKSDARGLRRFYSTLDPSEQADVAATFAERIGTNAKDGFTVTQFLRQTSTKNMSDEAIITIFGPQGAQSIKNLRLLSKEVERVTGAMNSRTSKSGVASYRDWMFSLLGGGGLGAASGGNLTAVGGWVMTAAAANAGKQLLTARALMSPKITKWLLQTPATSSPAAINRHFDRLGEIAKAEPALADTIDSLRRSIMAAANDNPASRIAAEDQQPQQ